MYNSYNEDFKKNKLFEYIFRFMDFYSVWNGPWKGKNQILKQHGSTKLPKPKHR